MKQSVYFLFYTCFNIINSFHIALFLQINILIWKNKNTPLDDNFKRRGDVTDVQFIEYITSK